MKTFVISFLIACLLFISFGMPAGAEGIHNDSIFSKLEEAFLVQLALSDKPRSWEDIEGMLDPYFTKNFTAEFMKGNIMEFEGGYAVPGSDFAGGYIPYFSYSDRTKVIQDKTSEKLYVQEKFKKTEGGPINENSRFETITLIKENGIWKIDEISYNSKEMENAAAIQPVSTLSTSAVKMDKPDKIEKFNFSDFLKSPRKTAIGTGLSAGALQEEMVKSFQSSTENSWTGGTSFLF
ncbi:hypothetical protein CVD28_15540 [Bacillus sp. M6-12]|uniref:DUF3993 domain-containing protein n=1 Tax=Bacillus sp. M6-12 TaxID=2054166 RepID=UPI000C75C22F|nr:DUF3993 domain-containing protein [Bacillus sp. M6-12]PLS16498.1 hypothetical protein CVD28_15540 [Bacillus sp. M6-12]